MPPSPGYRRKDYDIEPSKNRVGPKFVEPFSEWQLLVESTRAAKRLSIRNLAKECKVPAGTFFNWIRAQSGCPPYSSYKYAVNTRIAHVLGLDPEKLWQAYKQSLESPLPPAPAPVPKSQKNPTLGQAGKASDNKLIQLKNMITATGRTSFSQTEILSLIAMLSTDNQ